MTVAELKDLLNEFDEEANVSAYLQGALYSFSIINFLFHEFN